MGIKITKNFHLASIGTLLFFHVLFLTYSKSIYLDSAELTLQNQINLLTNNYNSIASILILEDSFTNAIESNNYAEVLRKTTHFQQGKLADSFLIYNTKGELFSDSNFPGFFGSKDELSQYALNSLETNDTKNIILQKNKSLYFYTYRAISTLNGQVGSVFIGRNINDFFSSLNSIPDLDINNLKIIDKSKFKKTFLNFSLDNFLGQKLPKNQIIEFKMSEWSRTIANVSISFLTSFFLYFSFITLWIRYKASQEKLLKEEVSKVSSARLVALGEMTAGLAHEINNPLTIIVFKLNQLTQLIDAEIIDKDKIKENIKLLSNTALRMTKIIKSIKSVSRNAESDPMEIINLKTIVDDTLELCSEKFKNNRVLLKTDFQNLDQLYINGRGTQIVQVLLNLLGNALDAVTLLNEKWVLLQITSENTNLFIKIIDSGNGIPEHVLEKMMIAFFTTKEVGKGTGLGLHISKNIIEEHQGEFYYDKNAKNTTFVIKLNLKSI